MSDGEETMGAIVGTWFGKRSVHASDWFHIARRLDRISHALIYLPYIFDFENRLCRHQEQFGHVQWPLWHGDLDGADWAIQLRRARIDETFVHGAVPEHRAHGLPRRRPVEHLRGTLIELGRHLVAKRRSLTNYAAAYRRSERVATAPTWNRP
jgi:hypothetical protein